MLFLNLSYYRHNDLVIVFIYVRSMETKSVLVYTYEKKKNLFLYIKIFFD